MKWLTFTNRGTWGVMIVVAIVLAATIIGAGYTLWGTSKDEIQVSQPEIGEHPLVTSTSTLTPGLPVIYLRYGGRVYAGLEGSHCWPMRTPFGTLCGDKAFQDPPDIIPVMVGDTIAVEVKAHQPPLILTALVFTSISKPPMQVNALATEGFATQFPIDLPTGVYIIQIFGKWDRGDISYFFKIEIQDK